MADLETMYQRYRGAKQDRETRLASWDSIRNVIIGILSDVVNEADDIWNQDSPEDIQGNVVVRLAPIDVPDVTLLGAEMHFSLVRVSGTVRVQVRPYRLESDSSEMDTVGWFHSPTDITEARLRQLLVEFLDWAAVDSVVYASASDDEQDHEWGGDNNLSEYGE